MQKHRNTDSIFASRTLAKPRPLMFIILSPLRRQKENGSLVREANSHMR